MARPPPSAPLSVASESSSGITYVDEAGTEKDAPADVKAVTANDTEWSDGWYVSNDTLTIGKEDKNQRVTVKGNVTLILTDNSDLTVWGGISVNEGSSLTIYAQTKYDGSDESALNKVGKLTAKANTTDAPATQVHELERALDGYAGIGGDKRNSAGTITINGGNIEAVGQGYNSNIYANPTVWCAHGAGIGGGSGGTGGHITINGGKVTAIAMGARGAGIGGGTGASAGDIAITGGVVEAHADYTNEGEKGYAAGIGGGGEGKGTNRISISGGTVTAYGSVFGANIGGGTEETSGSIRISGGTVTCPKIEGVNHSAAAIGGGQNSSKNGTKGDIVISGGTVIALNNGNGSRPAIGGDETMGNLYISGDANVQAVSSGSGAAISLPHGTLEISGGNVNATSNNGAGICVDAGSTLLISGGAVEAKGAGVGAGIGSTAKALGTIEITGGVVTASSETRTGIGNGDGGQTNSGGGTIKISGGTVAAKGGCSAEKAGVTVYPGIGGGLAAGNLTNTTIEISGGVVVAQGGTNDTHTNAAPGIAGAYKSRLSTKGNTITISGGTITSTGGEGSTYDLGSPNDNIVITGGSVKVRGWDENAKKGGMITTPKDAAGNDVVLVNLTVEDALSSVSVDDKPYYVENKHSDGITEDNALYLYVSKGSQSHTVTVRHGENEAITEYQLTKSAVVDSFDVEKKSDIDANKRNSATVSFNEQSYTATYGEKVDVAVKVTKDSPITTFGLMSASADMDSVTVTATGADGAKTATATGIGTVSYGANTDTGTATVSLDVSKLPVGEYTLTANYGGGDALKESVSTDGAKLTISPRKIVLNGVKGVNRAYNEKTHVSLQGGSFVYTSADGTNKQGVVNGDEVYADLSAGGDVADASVGKDKAVTVTEAKLAGDAEAMKNYELEKQPGNVTVEITTAAQTLAYAQTEVTKYYGDAPFTNEFSVKTAYGTISYTSDNEDVATVDANGKVTIVGIGEAKITATALADTSASNNYTASAAVSYELTVNPRPAIPSSPHEITVSKLGRGSVSLNSSSARKGETVTITATPDEGFSVQSVSATDANGVAVAVTKAANGTYTFVMPDAAVSVSVTFAKTSPTAFTDVDETQWYAEGVKFVSQAGIMNGYSDAEGNPTGIFGVGKVLTRAEFAGLLFNYAGGTSDTAAKNETGLADVADGAWYTSAANWAVKKGIIHGSDHADGTVTFDPNSPVTLEQMVAILSRVAGADISKANASTLAQYKDATAVSGWATQAVAWGSEVGLFSGSVEADGRYIRPTQDIMRERVAAVMMNAYTKGVLK